MKTPKKQEKKKVVWKHPQEFTFKVKHHKSGEWMAQCVEHQGIFTGGWKKGRLSYEKDVYPQLCDLIVCVLDIKINKV